MKYFIKLYTTTLLHDKPTYVVLEDGKKVSAVWKSNIDAEWPIIIQNGYIETTEAIYNEANILLQESNYSLWITTDTINGTPLTNTDIVNLYNQGNFKGYEFVFITYYNANGSVGHDTLFIANGLANTYNGGNTDYSNAIKIVGIR